MVQGYFFFHWQIAQRFMVQDENELSNLENPFLTPKELYEMAFRDIDEQFG